MTILDHLYSAAARSPKRVLLPESVDERICAAATACAERGLAHPVFLERPQTCTEDSRGGAEVFYGSTGQKRWSENIEPILASVRRRASGAGTFEGDRTPASNLYTAAALLRAGFVDLVVAGAHSTSADVLRAGIRVVGVAPEASLVSSAYLMEWSGRVVTFADCAVIPTPTEEQLAEIAANAARFHRRVTGDEPLVAFLAYSTKGSAEHAALLPVRSAVAALQRTHPGLAADGEMQFDCAFVPEIGRRKAPESPVAGHANVFVFPDLNSANIACKVAIHMGRARPIGPFLCGIAKPWVDIPRGSITEEIVDTIVTASALVDR